jgi:transcriptional regulator with XRE-family HTH domain
MQDTRLHAVRGRLRERRERLELTQDRIGEAVGFTGKHVGAVENGGSASPAAIVAVSSYLAAIECGVGLFETADVRADVAQLGARVAELELRIEASERAGAELQAHVDGLELEHADSDARVRAAVDALTGRGNGNGGGDVDLDGALLRPVSLR